MHTPTLHRASMRAISLVECVIVISLLSILSVLALSTLKQALASAREVTCSKRIRALSLAIFNYQAEHNGSLPGSRVDGAGSSVSNTWPSLIYPYMGIKEAPTRLLHRDMVKALTCPSEKRVEGWNPPREFWHSHYGVNSSGIKTFGFNGDSNRPSIEQFAATMMLIESANCRALRPRPAAIATIAYRHNKLVNVVFFDGHLEKRSSEQIPTHPLDPFWHE